MDTDVFDKLGQIQEMLRQGEREMQRLWREEMLFTWRWWLLLAITVLPWVFWIFFRKKECTARLLFVGLFSILVAKLLDAIGTYNGLWEYTYRLYPFIPLMQPWDLTLMPVAVMFLLQFKPHIHPVPKAVTFAAIASFVIEPTAVWLGLYRLNTWRHVYSFPIFTVLYLMFDWVSKRKSFECIKNKKA